MPGSFVAVGKENSQNVQEEDMILQKFSGILTSYSESANDISHFSLSFTTTHTAESPGPVPGLFVSNE